MTRLSPRRGALLLWLLALMIPGSALGATPIEQAEMQVVDVDTPPQVGDWQPVPLPVAPRGGPHIARNATIWLAIRLPDELPSQPAVYLPRLNVAAQVYQGDRLIAGFRPGGRLTPISWNAPVLAHLSGDPGASRDLFIRLESGPFGAVLATPLLGEVALLSQLYESRYFWQVATSEWAFLACLLMGTFTLLLWFRRKQDGLYLNFTGASWCWCVLTLYMFLPVMPMELQLWLAVVHTAATWCSFLLIRFVTRLLGGPIHWLERTLFVVGVVATLVHFLAPVDRFFIMTYALHLPNIAAILGVGAYAMFLALRDRNGTALWAAAGYIGVGSLVARDVHLFLLSPDDVYVDGSGLMQLSIPFLLGVLFVHLVERYIRALDEAETLNRELESRVEANRQAPAESFETQRVLEVEKGAAMGREKIYRDLHEDVGSKLVNILHTRESGEVRDLARGALESLRGAIYRVRFPTLTVAALLERLTDEFELRLGSAGIVVNARLTPGGVDTKVSPDHGFHVIRVCRELISNILQHSRASEVSISIGLVERSLEFVVRDDGIGVEGDSCSGGGIENARARIQQLGGTIAWDRVDPSGTAVRFDVPLGSGAPESNVIAGTRDV